MLSIKVSSIYISRCKWVFFTQKTKQVAIDKRYIHVNTDTHRGPSACNFILLPNSISAEADGKQYQLDSVHTVVVRQVNMIPVSPSNAQDFQNE